MSFTNPSDQKIKEILHTSKTIAVVGLSDKPERTSYMVTEAMQAAGYTIIPVNPMATEVLGEKCYASLKDIKEDVDIVNIFRRSEFVYESRRPQPIFSLKSGTSWFSIGCYPNGEQGG